MECKVDVKQVEEFAGVLYNESIVKGAWANSDDSVTVCRNLNIHQKGVVVLVTPLYLILYYPVIKVIPTVLNFGNIWIGNSYKASFTIYNYSGK